MLGRPDLMKCMREAMRRLAAAFGGVPGTQPIDQPDHVAESAGRHDAALRRRGRAPMIYVDVPSIDDAIKKVQAAGGAVVTPTTPIPNMGASARVRDIENNVIGLFSQNA